MIYAEGLQGESTQRGHVLRDLRRRLHTASTVSELGARAAALAPPACGFERAVMLTVSGDRLVAEGSIAVPHAASDALRLQALSTELPLEGDTLEAELIRRTETLGHGRRPVGSVLAATLGLSGFVVAPVVPESRVLALLVVDRTTDAVTDDDRATVELFAHLVSTALERTVLRARIAELSSEFRHMATSARALTQETLSAPVEMTTSFGSEEVFGAGGRGGACSAVTDLLTAREIRIMDLLVQGRSNRDIAEQLNLAPDTIKSQIARLLRKLNAANRVEAVGTYLLMRTPPQPVAA